MLPARPQPNAYRFGPFRLSVPDRILERDGERIPVTPKVIDTLFVLIENSGQVLTKEELIKAVWPDVNVVESGLTRNISALRKALEEDEAEGTYIETIPRRGYRFVAKVTEEPCVNAADPEAIEPVAVPAEPRRIRSHWRWAVLGALAVAGMAVALPFLNRERPVVRGTVEPSLRIGEHLLYKLAPEQTIRASDYFERAIAANPQSAGAHAGLSISLFHIALFGVRSLPEILPRAVETARKALELDARSSAAHYALAMVYTFKDWRFAAADLELRRALELDPESVQVLLGYARLKMITNDLSGALRLVERAMRLDPASPAVGVESCRLYYFRRDFRRAEAECREVLDREPGYALAHYYLALSLGLLGRTAEGDESLNRSGLMPGVVEADRAWLKWRDGDRRLAVSVLERRRELVRGGKVNASAKMLLAAILGRMDEAYESIEAGLDVRAPELLFILAEPRLDPLRADPRFPSVLQRIGIGAQP